MSAKNRMPAVFFGHGNPMNALMDNEWTRGWAALGRALRKPEAIVCVSAHWYLPGTAVTAMERPRTIHDFGGFPRQLYQVQYPAPGSPALAKRLVELLDPAPIGMDSNWGLDHGTWSVLMHAFPNADIPIVQLGIDETKAASWHYETAKRLATLRDEGVLIVGSGNLVHNLHAYSWGHHEAEPYDWAIRFERLAQDALLARNFTPLVAYETLGRDSMLSAPTPDHYLPLLYVIAQYKDGDEVTFPVKGFDDGSISMLTIQLG
jgi:4,5-DOPA dioxygenase extradiol